MIKQTTNNNNAIAIFSNLNKSDVFHYCTDYYHLYLFCTVSVSDIIRFLKFVVLQRNNWQPPPSPNSADLGIPQTRLGQPCNSVITKFIIPDVFVKNDESFKTDSITCKTRRVFPPQTKSLIPNLMVVNRALKTPGDSQGLASAGSNIDPEEQPTIPPLCQTKSTFSLTSTHSGPRLTPTSPLPYRRLPRSNNSRRPPPLKQKQSLRRKCCSFRHPRCPHLASR